MVYLTIPGAARFAIGAWLATKADIKHMLQILDKGGLNNEK